MEDATFIEKGSSTEDLLQPMTPYDSEIIYTLANEPERWERVEPYWERKDGVRTGEVLWEAIGEPVDLRWSPEPYASFATLSKDDLSFVTCDTRLTCTIRSLPIDVVVCVHTRRYRAGRGGWLRNAEGREYLSSSAGVGLKRQGRTYP